PIWIRPVRCAIESHVFPVGEEKDCAFPFFLPNCRFPWGRKERWGQAVLPVPHPRLSLWAGRKNYWKNQETGKSRPEMVQAAFFLFEKALSQQTD
ncbi:hypothetical protein, partial [uncultured Bilophila sp.]|uniref:hypothetical protein n=1 Tax=uncultured Bilophila sp. TaxID=529385 RepID=UPI00280ABDCA